MARTNIVILVVILSLLNISCSLYSINSEEISENVYVSKKSPDEVVYLEEIDRPYEVIGYMTVNTERNQKLESIIEKMRKEAALIGGDAITNIQVNASQAWQKIPPHKLLKNAYIRANFTATVVAFQ